MTGVYSTHSKSLALKISLFATGCAGIVAEFVLSTLATYLIGNAIFQWTMVMSLMLFAMGLGSRLSRFFRSSLLDMFILVEFSLSILCAVAAAVSYSLASVTSYIAVVIYLQAFMIGCLIGLEIPLVTRLNEAYEELRINISGVMEKDYYGALVGGLAFAFLALPHLGLTYTPIALGSINFLVASFLLWRFFSLLAMKKRIVVAFGFTLVFLCSLAVLAEPIVRYGEQRKYKDKIIYADQTIYQKIVLTQWKQYYWLYINGQEQFSTYDEEKYHEPLVHPAMQLTASRENILVLGGGDGLAVREILKYEDVGGVTIVDMDPAMTGLARNHPVLSLVNKGAMQDPKVRIINKDAAVFVREDAGLYGVVVVDMPDPDSIDLMHVYSLAFYRSIHRHLVRGGVMVTQATSPYFARKAFLCINKTIQAAGFATLPYHNQIPTMGEWGWVLGKKREDSTPEQLRQAAGGILFDGVPTRFVNRDAMTSMIHFGKGVFEKDMQETIKINRELAPELHRYYLDGTWGMY